MTSTTEEAAAEITSIGLKYPNNDLIVGVEGGGTSFSVSIARRIADQKNDQSVPIHDNIVMGMEILLEQEFPTSDDPQETISHISEFLVSHRPSRGSYASLGVACFGPLELDPESSEYGTILHSTPKANWRNVNIVSPILQACGNCPHKFDTDVNAPALAEFVYSQQKQRKARISSLAYVTVGTGVGVGLIINHKPVHGMMHPEGGHIHVQPMEVDTFQDGYSWGRSARNGMSTGRGVGVSEPSALEHIVFCPDADDPGRGRRCDLPHRGPAVRPG